MRLGSLRVPHATVGVGVACGAVCEADEAVVGEGPLKEGVGVMEEDAVRVEHQGVVPG